MLYSWLSVLPPLVVIIITIATRNVIISLTSGILTACLIASSFNPFSAVILAIQRVLEETHIAGLLTGTKLDHVYTFCFLLLLGVLIQLMNHSGGIRAYTQLLLKYIKTPRAAQQTSLLLSSTLFIDDYVNNLTVSAVLKPVTDHFKIARAKLAFLLDSMSGPLCMLIPASSWVAFILAQMQTSGINTQPNALIQQDGLFVYLAAIPFMLYPLLIVFSAWFIVSCNFSYGLMADYEDIAQKTGNLYGGKDPIHKANTELEQFQGNLFDFILPISTFIITFIGGIFYSGNSTLFGGSAGFMQTLQQADPFWALFIASLIAVTFTTILFLHHNFSHYRYIGTAFVDGFMLMKNSLIILLLAWTLSTLLQQDLHTGTYLASLLPTNLSVNYLPLLLFILCTVISASIGSVWATIALMLPIAIPLYVKITGDASAATSLYPLLGGLFSGSVAGSHFSPITDAMITTSFSAGCYHLDHVRTQMSYASNALIGAAAGFLCFSLLPAAASYGAAIAITLCTGLFVTATLITLRAWAYKRLQ